MLWEVEISPKDIDFEARRLADEFALLYPHAAKPNIDHAARGYLLEGELPREDVERLLHELLLDPLVESGRVLALGPGPAPAADQQQSTSATDYVVTVLPKPGVMDPVAESVTLAAADLGIAVANVRTFRRYYFAQPPDPEAGRLLWPRVLANDAIEQIIAGPLHLDHLTVGQTRPFELVTVRLGDLDDAGLLQLSRQGQLSLNLVEMKTIQAYFRSQGRDPTDVELETIAQTWSEHCSHKTLKGRIDFRLYHADGRVEERSYGNLLRETIFAATQQVRQLLGEADWCVSVFEDNA
ncbi:MAG: phosphoribosylformylglycinamidine synthase, partial [Gemmataceae bacterium]|nr:phosphoribosylformylglycinamidine synthase [Gemmataceae bacterium]